MAPAITLNPGFVLILAALAVLGAPRGARAPTMAVAALSALWVMLIRQFGAEAAVRQMGLPVVLLNLDALDRIFGIAMLIVLTIISLHAGARRSRYEDAAILLLAGGAVTALFVGDLVSFVAAAELAGLGAAWVVFASPLNSSSAAGIRLLIWHGLEGLLFLVGVALHLSAGADSSIFARMDVRSVGDAFIFAALMIRVGAPLAHVWLKDAIGHASATGAAALSSFSTMLGVYALARLFPAEPILIGVGAFMVVLGALLAMAEDDLRRAASNGLTAVTGVCVMLIGVGSPLALAAAEGYAFTAVFAFAALQMTLGGVLERQGQVRLSSVQGLWRAMPISAALMLFAGLAAAGAPGVATYATLSVALEATAQWETRFVWTAISALGAGLFIALALRPSLSAFRNTAHPLKAGEAPFPMLLGSSVAAFFCLSVGLAPGWLYGLMPSELQFQPFSLDRLAPQLELLGTSGLVMLGAWVLKLAPGARPLRLLDVDSLYRGPVAGAARWAGIVLLRLYGAVQNAGSAVARRVARVLGAFARASDRPYGASAAAVVQLASFAILVILLIVGRDS